MFGRQLRVLRKKRGLTIEELGQEAGLGYKHVADLERAVKTPSFEAVERLSEALQVPVHELFVPARSDGDRLKEDGSLRDTVDVIEQHGSPKLKHSVNRLLQEVVEILQSDRTTNVQSSGLKKVRHGRVAR